MTGLAAAIVVWFVRQRVLQDYDAQNVIRMLQSSVWIILIVGFFVAMVKGTFSWNRHVALRILLTAKHVIPWNYPRFLDYCAERIFLRKVGGGYIFVHRMLMEYFASLDTSEQESDVTLSR
jgi:hypothetical protein